METFLLTLSPFVVAILTNYTKPLMTRKALTGYTKSVVRFGVALFSLLAVVLSAYLSGAQVDVASLETFSQALMVFLGATGTYFLTKKK